MSHGIHIPQAIFRLYIMYYIGLESCPTEKRKDRNDGKEVGLSSTAVDWRGGAGRVGASA